MKREIKNCTLHTLLFAPILGMACDPSGDGEVAPAELSVPATYEFPSRFEDGDSVAYAGQTVRHVLVMALTDHVGAMTDRIDTGAFVPAAGDVVTEFDFYYAFDSHTSGSQPHGIEMPMPALQRTYDDISQGKNLQEKIAGMDEGGQHVDWSAAFVGWNGAGSPDALVRQWFTALESLAIARAQGEIPVDPEGNPIGKVHVSAAGQDYQQLLQKFLLGAVMFSQAADDYLDDDIEGKGLRSDNTEPGEGKPFTELEHGWDEAFGYFGAARDYLAYTDDEIAGAGGRPEFASGFHDTTNDGVLDLEREYNFGHAVNAAKRDRGSSDTAPTDFSGNATTAFLTGRAIISSADGALNDAQFADLQHQRDIIVENWEAAIASTVVHYINDIIVDMAAFETGEYSFSDHAKHWSELKGFALSLQFNPRSPLSDSDFARLHAILGEAPVLPGADGFETHREALLEARSILGAAYGFMAANLGDDQGEGGW